MAHLSHWTQGPELTQRREGWMGGWAETRVPSLLHPYHGDGRAGGWKPAGVAQQGVNDLAPPPSAGKQAVGPQSGARDGRTGDGCFLGAECDLINSTAEAGEGEGRSEEEEGPGGDPESEFTRAGTQGPAGKQSCLGARREGLPSTHWTHTEPRTPTPHSGVGIRRPPSLSSECSAPGNTGK